MKLNYGRTFTLGLGFMAISITWSVYNAFVPIFYESFVKSGLLLGFLMVTDNIIGISLQPWVSHRSDKTWSKWGRRMPFVLLAAPIGAVLFALIPFHTGLLMLLCTALGMNLAMGFYRAPTVALMPDITPRPLRSQANGIINFMGGLGSLIAYFVAGPLYRMNQHIPFILTAVIVLIAVAILRWRIREPEKLEGSTQTREAPFLQAVGSVFRSNRRSTLWLLLAIFAWFIGFNGIEAFFTLYCVHVIGVDAAAGALTLGFLSVAFLAFAIPAGFLSGKWGRKNTIRFGLIGLVAVLAAAYFTRSIWMVRGLFLFAGLFWAMVNVNSYPMVVEMATDAETGTYTGLYYFFSNCAAIAGPILFGLFRDFFGWEYLTIYALVPMFIALLVMSAVRGGEPQKPGVAAKAGGVGPTGTSVSA